MDILLLSDTENRKRIKKVEEAFSPSGVQLSVPGRILVGEGTLMKQGRKKWERKAFFLFNNILVYGSIVVNNSWYKNQKVIALKDIRQEDLEDSADYRHQWLICTPSKSFYVSAHSYEEKRGWMAQIETCQRSLLQGEPKQGQPNLTFARCWIPDQATQKCMCCLDKFTGINRRHHCRVCGFVVCNECSKGRGIIERIHPNKALRICKICIKTYKEDENSRQRGDSAGLGGDAEEGSSDDE
ncbi:pleckstrin homology domain-containing family F member 1-like [Fundulus diaphanus]